MDLCPDAVLKESLRQLHRLLKMPGARRQPYAVRSTGELMVAARGFGKSAVTPVFCISSVDGTNVPLLRQFFNLMPSRRSWRSQVSPAVERACDRPADGTATRPPRDRRPCNRHCT